LRDAEQKTVSFALLALVPPPSQRGNSNLYKSVVSDSSGGFTLRGVAPGEYTLFAWETVLSNAWMNPEFLAAHEARGQKITLNPGSSARVDVQVIR
jgi:hypothetical protein